MIIVHFVLKMISTAKVDKISNFKIKNKKKILLKSELKTKQSNYVFQIKYYNKFVTENKLLYTKLKVSMEKFKDLIQSKSPVLVDFFAEWCAPCKMMKPILEDLKIQVGDSARIVKIDVDQYEELAAKYRIQSVPTLMIFKEGEPIWRQSGVMQAADLKEIIEKYQ